MRILAKQIEKRILPISTQAIADFHLFNSNILIHGLTPHDLYPMDKNQTKYTLRIISMQNWLNMRFVSLFFNGKLV